MDIVKRLPVGAPSAVSYGNVVFEFFWWLGKTAAGRFANRGRNWELYFLALLIIKYSAYHVVRNSEGFNEGSEMGSEATHFTFSH